MIKILVPSVLLFIVWFFHRQLVPQGLGILNSDAAIYLLAAEDVLKGNWGVFPFVQCYAGLILTYVRALWIFLFRAGLHSPDSYLLSHFTFSFYVTPILLSFFTYKLGRALYSKIAAFMMAVTAAVSYQSWIHISGLEYYMGFLMLTLWMLTRRAKNPADSMIFGVLAAINITNWRAGLIPLVACLVPWARVLDLFKTLWRSAGFISRFLKVLTLFNIILALHLEWTHGLLGQYRGHMIKLHALSQWRITYAVGFAWITWCLKGEWFRLGLIFRLLLLIMGMAIGFLPEVDYFMRLKTYPINWVTSEFSKSLQTLPQVPHAFFENLLGFDSINTYHGISQVFPVFLAYMGLIALFWIAAKRKTVYLSIAMMGFLSVIAFCRVGLTGLAESRYLIPIMVPVLAGVGAFSEWAFLHSKRTLLAPLLVLFMVGGNMYYQWEQRKAFVLSLEKSNIVNNLKKISEEFQKAEVRVVISDNYWKGGTVLTLASHEKPMFTPMVMPWNPPKSGHLALKEDEVGILLTDKRAVNKKNEIDILGRVFKARFLTQFDGFKLYLGKYVRAGDLKGLPF